MSKNKSKSSKLQKRKKFYKLLSFILITISVLAASTIVYFDVLPNKYLIPGLVVLGIIIFFISYKLNTRNRLITKILCSFFSFIIIIAELLGLIYAFGTIDFFNNIFDTGLRTESYNIYVLKDSSYKELKDMTNKNIVIYKSESSSLTEATKKLDKKIKYNKVEMDSIYEAVESLIKKENDALYMSESLMNIYMEDHENAKDLVVLDTIDIITKTESSFKSVNVTKKPFIVYLSGIDTTGSINKVSRSDVNILAVVNPKSGKILLVNTPRDYYVTLNSKHSKDKLTHAGIYGIEESANTLGDLYGVEVNYFARVNFTSFVNIVDTLGGITVDVEKPDYRYNHHVDCGSGYVCEQNSERKRGSNTVYIKSGKTKLNGEQALAYSRNRYQYSSGDNARQLHQQQVIKGIVDKATSPSILTKYNSLLKTVSKGVLTNIEQSTITKLVNLQLDENIKWEIINIQVTGTGSYDKTYSTGNAKAYVMIPNDESVNEAKLKIKEVMES